MKRSVAVWLLWVLPAMAAADGVLEGELGTWLDAVAAELGETLARHPRFSGETVRLVTLTPGSADGRGNELAEAVSRRLRQRLLAVEGVRLAVDRPRRDCEPPRQIGYLVRIEVAASGGREGRVGISVVDVAESVWVSGISHQWQGRLSGAERRALAAPVNRGDPGTAGSPIPLSQADAVAAAITGDLQCTLPRSLEGAMFVVTPEPTALSRVGLALQGELMFEPLAAVTPDRDQARWLLTLEAAEPGASDGADVREVKVTLSDTDGGNRQRLASVFVSGPWAAAGPVAPPVADAPAPRPPAPVPRREADLLSGLEVRPARPEGICDDRHARVNSCVEISFELHQSAYLFVLSTRDHRVVEAPCDEALHRSDAGSRRFRVRVPPGRFAVNPADTGPDAGFYVLAVRERAAAEELRRVLAEAPGSCGRPDADGGSGRWLEAVQAVLARHGDRVEWRATHVVHDSAGIVAL